MELAIRASSLEDDIFQIKDRLMALENKMHNPEADKTIMDDIKALRVELQGLKTDYIELVGAKD
eukprot:gene37863-49621_t